MTPPVREIIEGLALPPRPAATAPASAAELLGAGILSVDTSGSITAWNARAESAFGWRRGDVIGHSLVATIVAPHLRQRHGRELERFLTAEEGPLVGRRVDVLARHRDGREFKVELALVPVPLASAYEYSDFLEDVASREWTHEQLESLAAEHEHVLAAVETVMTGRQQNGSEPEIGRLAGALVVFQEEAMGEASSEEPPVVSRLPVHLPADRSSEASSPMTAERLQRTIDEESFVLSCQPVLDLRTNDVAHYELLLRMTGDDGRLLLPQAFLGVAERSGVVRSINRWLVGRAVAVVAELGRGGLGVRLELNLSARALDDPELTPLIEQELAASGADPGMLVLGVSEDVAASAVHLAGALGRRLRAIGCRFALRDFGSSFAAMRHLKQLPLDYVRLDGGLVATIADSRTDRLVLKAIVEIADGMGAETVAQLVSDEKTLVLLRQYGVCHAQGVHVGAARLVSETFAPATG